MDQHRRRPQREADRRPVADRPAASARRTRRLRQRLAIGVGVALAAALLLFLLLNREYRRHFLSGGGFAQGALIAAIALGVVLTYRGSGVVNLANGAIAMYIAYVYAVLRRDGDLWLPPVPNPFALVEGLVHLFQTDKTFHLPDIPTRVSFGTSMSFWPALALSLGVCVLLGLALHFLVFRPLRNAPPLAKVVASVGIFVFIQAVVIRRFGISTRAVRPIPFVHKKQVDLGLTKVTQEQLFVAVLVIVFTVALWAVFRWTRFGLATRAAAENEKGAVVLGFSPDFLAGTNWVLSTLITGLLGVFVASITGIDPITLPALIVPAMTAALVGSFSSFGRTTIAAFVLGMQVPLVQYLGANKGWFPKSAGETFPGVDRLLPLVVIVVLLYIAGNALPERGAISSGRLPFAPSAPPWAIRVAGPILAVGTALAGVFVLGPGYRGALSQTLTGIIICLSVVVLTGFVGQISLAQMAFAGISAFLVSKLSTNGVSVNLGLLHLGVPSLPFPLPILLGALVAMGAGMLVAVPALRVRGVNLAIVTFAFAVAVDAMIFNNTAVNGGYRGATVKAPDWVNPNKSSTFLGIHVGDGKLPNATTAIFCLVAVVVLCYAVANIRRSTTGRQMLAMRSNERAAAAAGVNVSGTKMLAFAISAFIAGVGGAVLAYRTGNATPDKFDYSQSLLFLAFAYLGGISTVSGAIAGGTLVAGGLFFTFLDQSLGISPEFTLMLGGLGLILAAILNPEGITGGIRRDWLRLRARLQSRGTPGAPASRTANATAERVA